MIWYLWVFFFFFFSLKLLEGNAFRKGGQRKRRKRRCAHAKKSKYLPQLLKKYSAQCENEDTDQKLVSTIASGEKNATVSKGFLRELETLGRLSSSPKVIYIYMYFSCLTLLSMNFSLPINMKMPTIVGIFIFISGEFSCSAKLSKKIFAVVGNLSFISRANFMLSWVEHEKKFYNLGTVLYAVDSCIWILAEGGLNIFYFNNSTCDTHINISNKGGIRTKSRVLIEFFSQAFINLSTLWRWYVLQQMKQNKYLKCSK